MAHHFPQTAEVLCRALARASGHSGPQSLEDTAVLHVPGGSGLAGTYQGGETILQLLERMTDLTDGTLRFVPSRTFTTRGEMVVVCGHASAHRESKQLDSQSAYVVLLRGGRVREMWLAHEDQADFDEFWY